MKCALEAFGQTVAKGYLGLLLLTVFSYPLIFVGGFLTLVAYVLDHAGLSRLLGLSGLIAYLVFSFVTAMFFSVYAWPHVSPVIGKVMDQLGEAAKS
jgi:hypothetical protein